MITCYLRYIVDPYKLKDFEHCTQHRSTTREVNLSTAHLLLQGPSATRPLRDEPIIHFATSCRLNTAQQGLEPKQSFPLWHLDDPPVNAPRARA